MYGPRYQLAEPSASRGAAIFVWFAFVSRRPHPLFDRVFQVRKCSLNCPDRASSRRNLSADDWTLSSRAVSFCFRRLLVRLCMHSFIDFSSFSQFKLRNVKRLFSFVKVGSRFWYGEYTFLCFLPPLHHLRFLVHRSFRQFLYSYFRGSLEIIGSHISLVTTVGVAVLGDDH